MLPCRPLWGFLHSRTHRLRKSSVMSPTVLSSRSDGCMHHTGIFPLYLRMYALCGSLHGHIQMSPDNQGIPLLQVHLPHYRNNALYRQVSLWWWVCRCCHRHIYYQKVPAGHLIFQHILYMYIVTQGFYQCHIHILYKGHFQPSGSYGCDPGSSCILQGMCHRRAPRSGDHSRHIHNAHAFRYDPTWLWHSRQGHTHIPAAFCFHTAFPSGVLTDNSCNHTVFLRPLHKRAFHQDNIPTSRSARRLIRIGLSGCDTYCTYGRPLCLVCPYGNKHFLLCHTASFRSRLMHLFLMQAGSACCMCILQHFPLRLLPR